MPAYIEANSTSVGRYEKKSSVCVALSSTCFGESARAAVVKSALKALATDLIGPHCAERKQPTSTLRISDFGEIQFDRNFRNFGRKAVRPKFRTEGSWRLVVAQCNRASEYSMSSVSSSFDRKKAIVNALALLKKYGGIRLESDGEQYRIRQDDLKWMGLSRGG